MRTGNSTNDRSINAITKPNLQRCPKRNHICGSSLLEKAEGITLPYLTGGWKTKVWDVVEKEPHPPAIQSVNKKYLNSIP